MHAHTPNSGLHQHGRPFQIAELKLSGQTGPDIISSFQLEDASQLFIQDFRPPSGTSGFLVFRTQSN